MRLPTYEENPASSYGGLGRALMEKMGWSSGKGLGKNEDGMAEAIAPKKKEDAAGIGASGRYPWEEKLWEKSFASALSKLNGICDSSSDSDGDDSSSDSDSSGSGRKNKKDTHEVIRYGELSGRDGIAVSGSKAELMIAKELAKDKWGRWGGREGKMARIAEAEAKAAVEMGLQPPPRSAFASGEGDEASASDSEEAAQRKKDRAKRKKEKAKAKAEKRNKRDAAQEEEAPAAGKKKRKGADKDEEALAVDVSSKKASKKPKKAAPSDDDSDGGAAGAAGLGARRGADGPAGPSGGVSGLISQVTEWWGKYFVHAGSLEGLKNQKDRKRGFDEDDQENLYNKAQDGKAQGRLGLGVTSGSNPLKIGGARWKGKKVSFGKDGSDEDEGAAEAEAAEDGEAGVEEKPRRRGGKEAAAPAEADWGKVKWKAISEALLKEHGTEPASKGVKVSKLRSLAVARAEESLGLASGSGGDAADAAFDSRVLKSSRFAVQGKRIAVAAAAAAAEEGEAEEAAERRPRKKKQKKSKGGIE